jgi:AcrR family transcriptional regulator
MSRTATRPLPRAERRRSIVSGAARAFAAGGFDSTSMEDIADAAGVTKLIVYRHFESKEELYRSILEQVSAGLAAEVAAAMDVGRRRGIFIPAFLSVARQDPDGFRLLWRHSSRERQFAGYADDVRAAAVDFALTRLEGVVTDPVLQRWAAHVIVGFLVEAVLDWLDHGDPAGDAHFADVATSSMEALIRTWSSPSSTAVSSPAVSSPAVSPQPSSTAVNG